MAGTWGHALPHPVRERQSAGGKHVGTQTPPAGAWRAAWRETYLNEVPRLNVPDETFCQTFLWSWPHFRYNRIDVPNGAGPAGLTKSNNLDLKPGPQLLGDRLLDLPVEMLHDPQASRDTLLHWLKATRKKGLLAPGVRGDGLPGIGNYVHHASWMCGWLQKDLLTTNDLALLNEEIGEDITVLEGVFGIR